MGKKQGKVLIPLAIIFALNLLLLNSLEKYFFQRQLIFWAIGFSLFFLILKAKFSLANLGLSVFGWYFLTLVLLSLPLLFGALIRGSSRWILISRQSFQPSELAKPVYVFFLAGFLAKQRLEKIVLLLKILGLALVPFVLLLLQPNLGTALIFAFISAVLLFFSGLKLEHLKAMLILFLPLSFIFVRYFLADYQRARIESFFHPQTDPLGESYNLTQAMVAFGSGRFWGRGLGLGSQTRLLFLPERYTDFIFASLGESFGFMGALILLLSYFFLFSFLLKFVKESKEKFIYFFKFGLLAYLWFQTVVNLGINLGLLPVTGLPLPFFSYGGSSLVSSFLSLALIVKD